MVRRCTAASVRSSMRSCDGVVGQAGRADRRGQRAGDRLAGHEGRGERGRRRRVRDPPPVQVAFAGGTAPCADVASPRARTTAAFAASSCALRARRTAPQPETVLRHQDLTSASSIDHASGSRGGVVQVLPQEGVDLRPQRPGAVDVRVGAGHVGADLDQLLTSRQRGHAAGAARGRRPSARGVDDGARRPGRSTRARRCSGSARRWRACGSSTMCPSRIDRAVSAIGSLWSSPSTSTV